MQIKDKIDNVYIFLDIGSKKETKIARSVVRDILSFFMKTDFKVNNIYVEPGMDLAVVSIDGEYDIDDLFNGIDEIEGILDDKYNIFLQPDVKNIVWERHYHEWIDTRKSTATIQSIKKFLVAKIEEMAKLPTDSPMIKSELNNLDNNIFSCRLIENRNMAFEDLEKLRNDFYDLLKNEMGKRIFSDVLNSLSGSTKPKEGYVYVIEKSNGIIKIGRSITPERRIRTIETQMGENVINRIVVEFGEKAGSIENKLHREFKEFRLEGEWFNVCFEDAKERIIAFAEIIGKSPVAELTQNIKKQVVDEVV